MKLLINGTKIAGTATDDYTGPMEFIEAPEGFDPSKEYAYIDGQVVLAVPQSCTRRQGRLALLQNGLLDDVEDAITAIPDPAQRRAAQIEYEADTWDRGNAFLQGMWQQLGGDEEGLDDLFRLAVTL